MYNTRLSFSSAEQFILLVIINNFYHNCHQHFVFRCRGCCALLHFPPKQNNVFSGITMAHWILSWIPICLLSHYSFSRAQFGMPEDKENCKTVRLLAGSFSIHSGMAHVNVGVSHSRHGRSSGTRTRLGLEVHVLSLRPRRHWSCTLHSYPPLSRWSLTFSLGKS